MNTLKFIELLSDFSWRGVFNPYRDFCPDHDHPSGPSIRRLNLERYIDGIIAGGLDSIWLGRDCGYRGGRRTGIALTDEVHLEVLQDHLGIVGLAKATLGGPLKERTATEVWKIMREVEGRVFLWNVFPFHPYDENDPMTNRRHSSREFNECKELLVNLLEWLQPRKIIALGADAHAAVSGLGYNVFHVRHPSYGGHIEFANGIRRAYGS